MNFSATSDYNKEDGHFIQHGLTMRNISKLAFQPSDEVLDVGCGTGNVTKYIAKQVKRVTGIDLSEEMIANARTNNSATNINYAVWDAQTVGDNPEWRETFDKVVSFLALMWIPDQLKALRGILTCLKPGGEALFISVNRDVVLKEGMQFLQSHPTWKDYLKECVYLMHPWNRSVEETKDVFHQCGWTNVCSDLQVSDPAPESVIKLFSKTVFGLTAQIPDIHQDAFLDDLWHWMLSRWEDKSQVGLVQLPNQANVIKARKPVA
ncbi:demethylmenaquinone methyltransferase-like isoform X2 [Asterias rubens]|uniref:demethylmenaquinone methyltransferase-like isoform X1 n=1 Tax=Asterias rubens TaxID=7604 RepID=UPI0014558C02|nr:demethylmenaquinone methyltransferase-like isoform X1 [Asterias rubens]XP_033629257.1 demethylmenaquinone methyltransferase-like isoform X1 [Asterias rubens]XP_033629258.1 demethylmenaquinone methyltransferase-like isoform X1 [Asterias rubens]XP_033629259.1 demethylmenaquinone methyltransferase-like isoform X2 [Asterias rubens]